MSTNKFYWVALLLLSVVMPTLAFSLPASIAYADAGVVVDWNAIVKNIDPLAWGVNVPGFMDPAYTGNATWMGLVHDITQAKPLIRMHGWGMVAGGGGQDWLNSDGSWNAGKIATALRPVISGGFNIMIDVPDGPNNNGGSAPDPDLINNPDKIATWMASLVKIVNTDNGFHVKYWEFPNERDQNLSAGQMGVLLSKVSAAMKRIDPSILVGGPAMIIPSADYLQNMYNAAGGAIDFVTIHFYAGGSDYSSGIQARYDSVKSWGTDAVAQARQSMNAVSGGKHIPIFVDEYNISYETSPNNYNFNNIGMVYDALMAIGTVKAGGDASQYWEVSDCSWMSLICSGTRVEMSNLWTLLNKYFYGQEVSANSSNTGLVETFAAKSTTGTHALMLINRSDSSQNVTINSSGFNPSSMNKYVIDGNGYSGPSSASPTSLSMSPESIVVLTDGIDSGNSGGPGTTQPPVGTCTQAYSNSVAVPAGYGAAYNIFSTNHELVVQANCTNATATMTVGSGAGTQYIYKLGYAYKGGSWQPINLTGSGAFISSNWYASSAQGALPFTNTDLATWNYIVGYVCNWSDTAWKCGCADTACASSFWQLQAITGQLGTGTANTASESAQGTTIPSAISIKDAQGNTWTVTGGQIAMNGTINTVTGNVTLLLYYNHQVYQQTSTSGWYVYNGSIYWTATVDPRI